ncbi:nicotinamide-nucleotide amidase [Kribbella voronezhensis]|uniref:Nicotinamide-nucleotide amidase n=1 Tax=Kribbella voronezhensis TaxID=2512212 RepID=A0A4R7T9Y1_9ACTN|nr:CinA family protein [Kribbella voronezhensis]TDU88048.1 nicotinamide-nucleotide amidase [Kribbella voronezhensis]
MSDPAEQSDDGAELAAEISELVRKHDRTVAVAESLTSGNIACRLGAAPAASGWFAGGVTAYASAVKFEVLGVTPGPVITATCAVQMADGVARLTHADYAAAVTGVGGPDPEEGHPAGTVFAAVHTPTGTDFTEYHFDGPPETVVESATREALRMLLKALRDN